MENVEVMHDSDPFKNLNISADVITRVNNEFSEVYAIPLVSSIDANTITANTVFTGPTFIGKINYPEYSETELLDGYLLAAIRSKLGRAAKFNEDFLIKDFVEYIAKTYKQHYEQGVQPNELIFTDYNDGIGFTKGNIIKYAQRYGKKNGRNRDDLLKALHNTLLALYVHDKYEGK